MAWQNDDLILFHGCSNLSLRPQNVQGIIVNALPHGINPRAGGAKRPDFGLGFYTTTWLRQAKNWANLRVHKVSRKHSNAVAVVLQFTMKRDHLAQLEDLVFFTDKGVVGYCRAGGAPHAPALIRQQPYDVVYGPVSLVGQTHTINNSDQVSFHTDLAISEDSRRYHRGYGKSPVRRRDPVTSIDPIDLTEYAQLERRFWQTLRQTFSRVLDTSTQPLRKPAASLRATS